MVFCYGSCLRPLWLLYQKYHRRGGGELKQLICISHSPGGCQVQNHSAAKFGCWWEPSVWFANEYLVPCSRSTDRKRMQTLIQLWRPHTHDLITSPKTPFPNTILFQHINFRVTHSVTPHIPTWLGFWKLVVVV